MSYKVFSTAIIHELLDDEVIVANLDTGVYYSIRGSGVTIWQLLLAGHDLTSIAALFKEKYQSDLFASLQSFINQILKEELLTPTLSSNHFIPNLVWLEEFQTPTLEKYEEMKNLLMLDPIHEVDEQGWPSKSL